MKFEYKILSANQIKKDLTNRCQKELKNYILFKAPPIEEQNIAVQNELNNLGQEGWEIFAANTIEVTILGTGGTHDTEFILKRQID